MKSCECTMIKISVERECVCWREGEEKETNDSSGEPSITGPELEIGPSHLTLLAVIAPRCNQPQSHSWRAAADTWAGSASSSAGCLGASWERIRRRREAKSITALEEGY